MEADGLWWTPSHYGISTSSWQLPMAIPKCSLFQIGSHFNHSLYFPFTLNNIPLSQIRTVRDLGILVDDNLKFNSHINEILKRSNQRANLIHRTFLSGNQSPLITAYKVYVRPLLEYNSIIWSPSQIGLISNIESVQRSFTNIRDFLVLIMCLMLIVCCIRICNHWNIVVHVII